MRSLRGRLVDPKHGPVAHAHVRLVGDTFEAETDSGGWFVIPGIDFPSWVIALDVWAPFYRVTRHTIAWHPRRLNEKLTLPMIREETVDRIFSSVDSSRALNRKNEGESGNLIAGASRTFFKSNPGCLHPELWSVDHQVKVPVAYGPFPSQGVENSGPLCWDESNREFFYRHLPLGEYQLKWVNDSGEAVSAQVEHIGADRDTPSFIQ
jgi:hypothetical protein